LVLVADGGPQPAVAGAGHSAGVDLGAAVLVQQFLAGRKGATAGIAHHERGEFRLVLVVGDRAQQTHARNVATGRTCARHAPRHRQRHRSGSLNWWWLSEAEGTRLPWRAPRCGMKRQAAGLTVRPVHPVPDEDGVAGLPVLAAAFAFAFALGLVISLPVAFAAAGRCASATGSAAVQGGGRSRTGLGRSGALRAGGCG